MKYHFEQHLPQDVSNFYVTGILPQKLPITEGQKGGSIYQLFFVLQTGGEAEGNAGGSDKGTQSDPQVELMFE